MKIKLSKKEVKFLYALLGAMSDEDYVVQIDKSGTLGVSEKEEMRKFIIEQKAYNLYKKIAEIAEGKDE